MRSLDSLFALCVGVGVGVVLLLLSLSPGALQLGDLALRCFGMYWDLDTVTWSCSQPRSAVAYGKPLLIYQVPVIPSG